MGKFEAPKRHNRENEKPLISPEEIKQPDPVKEQRLKVERLEIEVQTAYVEEFAESFVFMHSDPNPSQNSEGWPQLNAQDLEQFEDALMRLPLEELVDFNTYFRSYPPLSLDGAAKIDKLFQEQQDDKVIEVLYNNLKAMDMICSQGFPSIEEYDRIWALVKKAIADFIPLDISEIEQGRIMVSDESGSRTLCEWEVSDAFYDEFLPMHPTYADFRYYDDYRLALYTLEQLESSE